MPAIVNIDGRLLPPAEAAISVLDRGFLSGDLVYEVVRTYDLRVHALESHLGRLARSAARTALPLAWGPERIARELDRTVDASRGQEEDDPLAAPWNRGQRTVRIVMTRGAGEGAEALGIPPGPRAVLVAQPLVGPPASAYRDGVRCVLVRARVPRELPGVKTGRHQAEATALADARAGGAHEALLVDDRGLVTEGATSSLFRVSGGVVETPPLEAGILPGIARALVLRLAREARIPATERLLEPQDLAEADEVFITSTTREVLPVTRLGERPVGRGVVGPATTRLHALYRAAVTGRTGAG
jgi:branched-chain amino acid aminotransferase